MAVSGVHLRAGVEYFACFILYYRYIHKIYDILWV